MPKPNLSRKKNLQPLCICGFATTHRRLKPNVPRKEENLLTLCTCGLRDHALREHVVRCKVVTCCYPCMQQDALSSIPEGGITLPQSALAYKNPKTDLRLQICPAQLNSWLTLFNLIHIAQLSLAPSSPSTVCSAFWPFFGPSSC